MKNAGYTIVQIEQYEPMHFIVLGHNIKNQACPYVTWEWCQKKDSYFWGHYFENYTEAIRDFHIRLAENYQKPF